MRTNSYRRSNDLSKQTYCRDNSGTNRMYGSGIADVASTGLTVAQQMANIAAKAAIGATTASVANKAFSSGPATRLRNAIPSSDSNARPGFKGETHMIMALPNHKFGVANFMGPGTHIIERVKRGDPGRVPSDTVAKRHDIDYTVAALTKDPVARQSLVRAADIHMINTLKKIKANKVDKGMNIQAGMKLIQAKILAEKIGLLKEGKFSGPYVPQTAADTTLLMDAQHKLDQEGFGGVTGGGSQNKVQQLRKKLLRKMKNVTQKGSGATHPNNSRSRSLGKQYVMKGSGSPGITATEIKKMIPALVKSVGLPASTVSTIKTLIPGILKKTKDPKKASAHLANAVMPILIKAHFAKNKVKMSGSGIGKINKGNPKLRKLLANGFSGGGFWSDFKKGFKKVFVPLASIAGTALDFVGVPEVGIPLQMASTAVGFAL